MDPIARPFDTFRDLASDDNEEKNMNYILDFIQQGGVIAYVLVAMNFVGYAIIAWKIIALVLFNRSIRKRLPAKILHRVVSHNTDHHIIMESIRTEIALAFSPLQKGMTTIENIASISPLLGLLGTVFGIFNAFSVIAVSGLSDAGAFATGIKLALITTVIGLVVAIPHVIAFNYLNASMEAEQDNVENDVLLQLGRILKEHDHRLSKETAASPSASRNGDSCGAENG